MEILVQTLNITGVGIALVFAGILILWGMMALLVRIFSDKQPKSEPQSEKIAPESASKDTTRKAALAAVAVALAGNDLKPKAAAAAVACALILGASSNLATATAPNIHSWQIANRIVQLNQRNQTFNRKPRGK